MTTKTEINHIDCFSGPGGICTGFKAAGIKTIAAIEKVESCVDTYRANHKEVVVLNNDIRRVTSEEIQSIVGNRDIDILTSGMPCETFSTAGSKSRSSYDFRQQLYSEAIRIAKAVKARIILFENVPGIESKRVEKGGKRFVVQDIMDELAANGYNYFIKTVLNSIDFGVPQYRNRFFLIATNDESLELRVPISHHDKPLTVRDAFLGLPEMEANDTTDYKSYTGEDNNFTKLLKKRSFWKIDNNLNGDISYHISPKHRKGTIERFGLIEPGESLVNLFRKFDEKTIKELQERRVLPNKWYIQRNKRLQIDSPSKTVTSHCLDELVHPHLNRGLTVREVARLQGFPDFYDFKGGPFICPHIHETQDKYEQIGDAVPPLLAYAWGKTIGDILTGVELKIKNGQEFQRVLF
jgi:DNA (cytosine-5)-methyltransferase 1